MSNASLVKTALNALLDSPGKRSKMGQFRDVAADVDRLVHAGVLRPAILETLAEHGLVLTPAQLRSYLRRWRTEHAGQASIASTSGPSQQPDQSAPPAEVQTKHPATAASASPVADAPATPSSGRSIREIRNAEVDFAAAEKWYRERQKATKTGPVKK